MKTDTRTSGPLPTERLDTAPALPALVRGSIVGQRDGRPVVAWGDGRTGVADCVHMENAPAWSLCTGVAVFLAFEGGDATSPVIVGFQEAPPRAVPETVRIESGREMVLECGKAKIALRADGRIEIRGGHLISRSSGPNKIKGGSVHIN